MTRFLGRAFADRQAMLRFIAISDATRFRGHLAAASRVTPLILGIALAGRGTGSLLTRWFGAILVTGRLATVVLGFRPVRATLEIDIGAISTIGNPHLIELLALHLGIFALKNTRPSFSRLRRLVIVKRLVFRTSAGTQ
jgi:hypothetical protein